MEFRFCFIDHGLNGSIQLGEIEGATFEVNRTEAIEAVNGRFQDIVSQEPTSPNLFVFTPSIGNPGTVVASEFIHAWPVEVRERQGRPARELKWVVDPSTGLE